jgi:NADH:ubiquinone oxidoreductase subunit 6 (subunit J)
MFKIWSLILQGYVCLVALGKNLAVLRFYKDDLLDIVQQTFIFVAVLFPFVLTVLTPYHKTTVCTPDFGSIQGIGSIKELLYGDFSLFLLFSTIVLLVALLGAAVMTRKK